MNDNYCKDCNAHSGIAAIQQAQGMSLARIENLISKILIGIIFTLMAGIFSAGIGAMNYLHRPGELPHQHVAEVEEYKFLLNDPDFWEE